MGFSSSVPFSARSNEPSGSLFLVRRRFLQLASRGRRLSHPDAARKSCFFLLFSAPDRFRVLLSVASDVLLACSRAILVVVAGRSRSLPWPFQRAPVRLLFSGRSRRCRFCCRYRRAPVAATISAAVSAVFVAPVALSLVVRLFTVYLPR